jgi:hypothetical protein
MSSPESEQPGHDPGVLASLGSEVRDVLIILASLAVLAVLGVFVVQHYDAAGDATSVLGVLVPAVATIAAAAFGVSTGVKAGAAAGSASAQAARTETQSVRTQTVQALSHLDELERRLDPVMEAAGTRKTELPAEELAAARSQLGEVQQTLRAAL